MLVLWKRCVREHERRADWGSQVLVKGQFARAYSIPRTSYTTVIQLSPWQQEAAGFFGFSGFGPHLIPAAIGEVQYSTSSITAASLCIQTHQNYFLGETAFAASTANYPFSALVVPRYQLLVEPSERPRSGKIPEPTVWFAPDAGGLSFWLGGRPPDALCEHVGQAGIPQGCSLKMLDQRGPQDSDFLLLSRPALDRC